MKFLWIGILILTSGCASIGFQNQTNCIQGLICPEGPKIVPSATAQLVNLPKPKPPRLLSQFIIFQILLAKENQKIMLLVSARPSHKELFIFLSRHCEMRVKVIGLLLLKDLDLII